MKLVILNLALSQIYWVEVLSENEKGGNAGFVMILFSHHDRPSRVNQKQDRVYKTRVWRKFKNKTMKNLADLIENKTESATLLCVTKTQEQKQIDLGQY